MKEGSELNAQCVIYLIVFNTSDITDSNGADEPPYVIFGKSLEEEGTSTPALNTFLIQQ
jgi:hypothetical protein